ncbi:Uncharacterised protein [Mycobacteroides abscessus subsp. abscessus]|nr:Uncharacterised protein [Mycobacteroides abscessus subsp. abscessus]
MIKFPIFICKHKLKIIQERQGTFIFIGNYECLVCPFNPFYFNAAHFSHLEGCFS